MKTETLTSDNAVTVTKLRGRERVADAAFWALDPDADDATIAAVVAECLVAGRPPHILSICHHVPDGACPLRYDWHLDNCGPDGRNKVLGIETRDREEARAWATEATLLGYAVERQEYHNKFFSLFERGSIADVRRILRREKELKRKQLH